VKLVLAKFSISIVASKQKNKMRFSKNNEANIKDEETAGNYKPHNNIEKIDLHEFESQNDDENKKKYFFF
jgi:hypothetical protein